MLLKKLSEITAAEEELKLKSGISAFSCKDKDVENFLKSKALDYELRNKSRTYVLFDRASDDLTFKVYGYFTLSLKVLTFGETVSKSVIKDIDGFNKNAVSVPALLIGQFGKDISAPISGEYLMNRCLHKLRQIREMVGGRIVLIECLPIKKIEDFYKRNGFKFLQTDENDKYRQMILTL